MNAVNNSSVELIAQERLQKIMRPQYIPDNILDRLISLKGHLNGADTLIARYKYGKNLIYLFITSARIRIIAREESPESETDESDSLEDESRETSPDKNEEIEDEKSSSSSGKLQKPKPKDSHSKSLRNDHERWSFVHWIFVSAAIVRFLLVFSIVYKKSKQS